jgi:3',5'-cyclic AMP phosphodiesterase CpdA
MDRREFVKQVGLGLAAGWAAGRLAWPFTARAADPEVRLALLADAHLKDGNDRRPGALALARAVREIGKLSPPPELVLFAGDLAHRGRPDALDLGREILADLPAPVWAVCGEGDHGPRGNSAWVRRWGAPWFSRAWRGFHLIGLDTSLVPAAGGPVFELGAVQRRWLARELALLSPATPLVIVSHAPLARLFHPWQQWTGDAPEVARLLGQFTQVLCLHGHVHGVGVGNAGVRGQGSGVRNNDEVDNDSCNCSLTGNRKPETGNHLSLPATAWPRPLAVQGTPATPRPGLGPGGCGWALASLSPTSHHFRPYLWQA